MFYSWYESNGVLKDNDRSYMEDLLNGVRVKSLSKVGDSGLVLDENALGVKTKIANVYLSGLSASYSFLFRNNFRFDATKSITLFFTLKDVGQSIGSDFSLQFGNESLVFKITKNGSDARVSVDDDHDSLVVSKGSDVNFLIFIDKGADRSLCYINGIRRDMRGHGRRFQSFSQGGELRLNANAISKLAFSKFIFTDQNKGKVLSGDKFFKSEFKKLVSANFSSTLKFVTKTANLNQLNIGGAADNGGDPKKVDLEKFIVKDFTSSSGISALSLTGIADKNEVLKSLRAVQRNCSFGVAIGPSQSISQLDFGNKLSLDESIKMVDLGYYSASQVAHSNQLEIEKILSLSKKSIQSSDSDKVKDAKHRHNNRAKLIIAAARQRAHLVSLAYINTKNLSNPALIAAQRSDEDPSLTFENLYNSGEYFDVSKERSVYSLPAYTVALKELVDTHITTESGVADKAKSKLVQRRPDIVDIKLSAENSSRLQPKLNIVNQLLRYHANTDPKAAITDAAMDNVSYPLNYPYNANYDKADVALKEANISWGQIRQLFANNNVWSEFSLGISPSQVGEIAKDNAFSNNTMTPAVSSNKLIQQWGFTHLPASSVDGKETQTKALQKLKNVSRFVAQADLNESQLHELLFADLSQDEIAADRESQLYFNVAPTKGGQALNSLAFSADATELLNLDDVRKDRLRRFISLARAMKLDYTSLHRLLRATGNRINNEFLRCLSAYQYLTKTFKIELDQFIALIGDMRNQGRGNGALPVYTFVQSIFYSKRQAVNFIDHKNTILNVSWDPSSGSGDNALIRSILAHKLKVSEADVKTIARMLKASGKLVLNLQNLSALYRVSVLAGMLSMTVNDIKVLITKSNKGRKLIEASSSLADKLKAIAQLLEYGRQIKLLKLSPEALDKLTNNSGRININNAKTNEVVNRLQQAMKSANKLTLENLNLKLSSLKVTAASQAQFDEFVSQGLVTKHLPAFLSVISDVAKRAKVKTYIEQFIQEQQELFDVTLAEIFKLSQQQARVFSSWLAAVILADSDSANMQVRLEKGLLLDFRAKLLSTSESLDNKRRYLQQGKQLAEIISLFTLTKDNWQQLLQKPVLLSGLRLDSLPSFEAVLGLAQYEGLAKKIDNRNTPVFSLALAEKDAAAASISLQPLFKDSDVVDFEKLIQMYSGSGRAIQQTLDGLGRIGLALMDSQKLKLKPEVLQNLLAIGEVGKKSYAELAPVYKQLASSLQTDEKLSEQARVKELEGLRDRLLSLALYRMKSRGLPIADAKALQRYLLTDVFVGGESKSSVVKEASLVLQQFADQVLTDDVPGHKATETFKQYWRWMSRYTSWEANRRTFFETENFLLPELRRNKSEAFKALESKMSQVSLNPELAKKEFKAFAREALQRSNMEIVSIADGRPASNKVMLIARTLTGERRELYYRITELDPINAEGEFLSGEWRKLDSIEMKQTESRVVSACYAFGQWHIFWVTYQKQDSGLSKEISYEAKLWQISLEAEQNWSAAKEIRKAVVPAGVAYENKDNFKFLRAYNPNTLKLKGTKQQLANIWQRHSAMVKALADKGDGKATTQVLYDQMRPSGNSDIDNKAKFDDQIIVAANRQKDDSLFIPGFLKPSQNSQLKTALQAANSSASHTLAEGIVLVLPPVFGVFTGEKLDPEKLVDGSHALNKTAKVQLLNYGVNWLAGDNASFSTDHKQYDGVSKILLSNDGGVRDITGNKLLSVLDAGITSQKHLHGMEFGTTYLGNRDVRTLTAAGTVGKLGMVSYVQELGSKNISHEYILNKELKRFYRTRSFAADILLSYLGQLSLTDFMHPGTQRQLEAQFMFLRPSEDVNAPFPSNRLSFDDFNGNCFWELFFHGPMLLAQSLKQAGHLQQAEYWYQLVFNPLADKDNLGVVSKKGKNYVSPLLQQNSHWQSLALRKASPKPFKGEVFFSDKATVGPKGSAADNVFNISKLNLGQADIEFDLKQFDFPLQDNQGAKKVNDLKIKDFLKLNATVTKTKTQAVLDRVKNYMFMRVTGSQFLSAGNYVLQVFCDDAIGIKVNGEVVLNFTRPNSDTVRLYHVPVHIDKSGIQQFEVLFMHSAGRIGLSVGLDAAKPGVQLAADTNFDDKAAFNQARDYARLHHNFRKLTSQAVFEQRMLSEISEIDNEVALGAYIRDPYNPHAIARVNTNAYRIWTFYEYIDNLIKQGDVQFRKFTRESLPEATLLYSKAERLLGDQPVYRGLLDNLPADAKLQDIVNGSLLDYDNDGDIDLDDADIQAKRLIDAGRGKLQQALALMLENRLSRVSTTHTNITPPFTSSLPVAEAYTGDDTSAVLLKPRLMRYQGSGANRKLEVADFAKGKHSLLPQTFLNNSYFAIPQNKRTLGVWKLVASRLFNIRNGRNINGERVVLPLTQPSLSPVSLAKAASQGVGALASVLNNARSPIPHYRFNYAIERAESVTNMAISFGAKLQSLMQSKDASKLEELRATYEHTVLQSGKKILQEQLKSAETAIEIVLNGYGTARYLEYKNALRQNIEAPGEAYSESNYQLIDLSEKGGADKYHKIGNQHATQRRKFAEVFRNKKGDKYAVNSHEKNAQIIKHTAFAANKVLDGINAGGNFAKVAPNIFGLAVGGSDWKSPIDGAVGFARIGLDILSYNGDVESTKSDLQRRVSGWEQDRQLAIQDQDELENRLIQANHDRLAIVKQIKNLEQQIKLSDRLTSLITTGRFGKEVLFKVLSERMFEMYKVIYNIALSASHEAERAWVFEKARVRGFVISNSWSDIHKGLLAAETLMLSLQQMRQAYQSEDHRRFEIVKTISLKNNKDVQVDGSAKDLVTTLKEKAVDARAVTFSLPARIFDRDYPGHILRQIKSVSITIPAVVGPYENIGATLKQLNNNVLLSSDAVAAAEMAKGNSSSHGSEAIRKDFRRNQAIAVSTGVNDAGMFQLNFDDPRFLPFEGTGVDSKWQLQFSEFMPQSIFNSISDIIMEIRYTAEQGDSAVKSAVVSVIKALPKS